MIQHKIEDLDYVKKLDEKKSNQVARAFLVCEEHDFPLFLCDDNLSEAINLNFEIYKSCKLQADLYCIRQPEKLDCPATNKCFQRLLDAFAEYLWRGMSMYRNHNKVCVKCYEESLKFKDIFKEFISLVSDS